MRLLRFLISRTFWVQMGLAVVLGGVGFVALNLFLRGYTRHSERIAVPAVVGTHMLEASMALEAVGLKPVIMDSLYSAKGMPGGVVEQDPAPGVEVKGTRNVYLTVYRSTPPSERLEVEEGMDAGVARILMEVKGFDFSERYEPSADLTGLVLRVEDGRGRTVGPEDRLPKGGKVVLVIGASSSLQVEVPDLVGLPRSAGLQAMRAAGFSVGFTRWAFDPLDERDSMQALISAQLPNFTPGRLVQEGSAIDLTFSAPVHVPDSL